MIRLRNLLAAAALSACTALASAGGYSGLYIFGDSLSDAGNVAALVGSNGGQVISGNSYIPSQPYASGTFTNGSVWATSFAAALGLAAAPSLAGGGNFAFGGARVATDGAGLPPSLSVQTGMFLGATGGVAPAGALYVVEGGGNDARDLLAAAATSPTPVALIAAGAAAYAQSIGAIVDQLQAAGAQDIVVWDVPNLALAPAVTSLGLPASFLAAQVAGAMNSALTARMSFETGVRIFDIYGSTTAIVANPAAYGLTNVTAACGAASSNCNPATSLFWDGIHPTAAGHALLAQGMLAVVAVPEPATYALFAVGMLLIGWRARRKA